MLEVWVLLTVAASGGLVFAYLRSRSRRGDSESEPPPRGCPPCPAQPYAEVPPPHTSRRIVFQSSLDMHNVSCRFEDQPPRWRRAMRTHGRVLQEAGVAEVTFVHGTFLGTDPFYLVRALKKMSPRWQFHIERNLGSALKRASDALARDSGNFDRRWIRLFETSTRIPSSLYVWSSDNTHIARLSAACRLAQHLVTRLEALPRESPPRALLVGHSHAGQVFALLLQLLYAVPHAKLLHRTLRRLGEDSDWLAFNLDLLRKWKLDVVTLGTPVRYGWPKPAHPRLLHIVNHRGATNIAGSMDGFTTTRDGDYIQQWGIAGSDLPAPTARLRDFNTELDEVLGCGYGPRVWIENLRHRRRVHHGGQTLLVDYLDNSKTGKANFVSTHFGHAIYTRRHTMEFLIRTTIRQLYP